MIKRTMCNLNRQTTKPKRGRVTVSITTGNVMIINKFTNIRSKVNEKVKLIFTISNVIVINLRIGDRRYMTIIMIIADNL